MTLTTNPNPNPSPSPKQERLLCHAVVREQQDGRAAADAPTLGLGQHRGQRLLGGLRRGHGPERGLLAQRRPARLRARTWLGLGLGLGLELGLGLGLGLGLARARTRGGARGGRRRRRASLRATRVGRAHESRGGAWQAERRVLRGVEPRLVKRRRQPSELGEAAVGRGLRLGLGLGLGLG